MTRRNIGIITVSKVRLLKILDFEGGIIHDIRTDPSVWNPDEIQLVIEHPDLPEIDDGFQLLKVETVYTGVFELKRKLPPRR